MSQAEQIKNYLKAGNTLTALEALEKFGCLNLKGRIWDIRQTLDKDWVIESPLIETSSGKHVARYRMIFKNPQLNLFEGVAS